MSQNTGNIPITYVIIYTTIYTVINSHPKHKLPNILWTLGKQYCKNNFAHINEVCPNVVLCSRALTDDIVSTQSDARACFVPLWRLTNWRDVR